MSWHVVMVILSFLLWITMVSLAEPVLEEHSRLRQDGQPTGFPFIACALSWMGIFIIVSLHTGFFFYQGHA